jgi:hypothetical protein
MSAPRQDLTPVRAAVSDNEQYERNDLAEFRVRLLEEAHAAWQRAEVECERSLRAWYERSPRPSRDRYLCYLAALDREHAAAHAFRRLWEPDRLEPGALTAAASHTCSSS